MEPWQLSLRNQAQALGVALDDAQLGRFAAFMDALLDWNERVNLTSITDPEGIAALHFADSLTCLAATEVPGGAAIIDIGTGAGLPGVPIALARTDVCVTLLEATRKKCQFLEHAVSVLPLPDSRVVCDRAESAGRDPQLRESFDIAVIRAVAEYAAAAELTLPFLRVGGVALIMKGPLADEELARAPDAAALLGAQVEAVREFTIQASGVAAMRKIIVLRKVAATPDDYPRKPGRPARRPLGIDSRKGRG